MKTYKIVRSISLFGFVIVLSAFTACTTVDQLTQTGMGMFGGDSDDTETTASGESGGASTSGDSGESAVGIDPTTLTMLPPAAAFQIVYAQTVLFTAASVSVDDFLPGEGIRWALTWQDADGAEDTIYTEQALLTRDDTGEWWFIALSDGEYSIEYEYLVSTENVVTELLYRDSSMSETERATVNVPLDRMESDDEYDSFYDRIEADDTDTYEVTRRNASVMVPAGTFNAEVIEVVGTDPDSGESVDSTWWRVESVPGETVQFEYRTDEEETYRGRLESYGDDYVRTL